MPLPNFFIVGAPQAGTAFLYACLQQHPQIYLSALKEPNYFASELHPGNFAEEASSGLVTIWGAYLKLFDNVSDEIAIGEASPSYLWSQTAARNIASRMPRARIIINLRNPLDRAFSHYLHAVASGLTERTFRQEIEAALHPQHTPSGLERSLLEFGEYYEQIKRYQQAFSRPQMHISLFEDLQRTPAAVVEDLLAFLGVNPDIKLEVCKRHLQDWIYRPDGLTHFLEKWRVWPYLRNLVPQPFGLRLRSMLRPRTSLQMAPADRALLIDYYRDDIRRLAELLNRDLSAWLQPAQHDQFKTASLRRAGHPRHPR